MLQVARSAYSVYKDRMEKKKAESEMKCKAAEQEHKKVIKEEQKRCEAEKVLLHKKQEKDRCRQLQKELDKKKQAEQSNVLKAAGGLLADAGKNLMVAIKTGDMCITGCKVA